MAEREDRASRTIQAVADSQQSGRRGALARLQALEAVLNEEFTGQALNEVLRVNVLAVCGTMIQPPAGYRWQVEQYDSRLYPYLERLTGLPEGYRFAARVTIGFDGGNHPLRADLWGCTRCSSIIFPDGREGHDRFHAGIDGLLDGANQVAVTGS